MPQGILSFTYKIDVVRAVHSYCIFVFVGVLSLPSFLGLEFSESRPGGKVLVACGYLEILNGEVGEVSKEGINSSEVCVGEGSLTCTR